MNLTLEQAVVKRRSSEIGLRRKVAFCTIAVPTGATLLAVLLAATRVALPSVFDLLVMVTMYILTVLGITIGFHRLCAHRAFHAPNGVRAVWMILGSMAAQGPVIFWVAEHRFHHRYGDQMGDPHSPYVAQTGPLGRLRGFWHAHIGWMLEPTDVSRWAVHAPDLMRDSLIRWVNGRYWLLLFAGILVPGIVCGLYEMSFKGVCLGILWGGLVRIFLVHHATWCVNSICHVWGDRSFETKDQSRNNALVAAFTLGEGWHNNHHAFPSSARQGLSWREPDVSFIVILLLSKVGLASHLKSPVRPSVERNTSKS